jgi:ATP-dependent DNA ligase
MSATAITIKNTKQAIIDGVINGEFNKGAFIFNNIRYTTAGGKVSNWTISVKLLNTEDETIPITDDMLEGGPIGNGYKAIIETKSGQEGGKMRKTATIVTSGKHIGSSNETNIIEQAFRDALGSYNKKLIKVASNMVTTTPSTPDTNAPTTTKIPIMPPPMLVQKYKDLSEGDFKNGITLQRKLNGVHYITFQNEGRIIKYSRSGLTYSEHSMPKITEEMSAVFNIAKELHSSKSFLEKYNLYKDDVPYFAGELYKHGVPLNIISGQARKETSSMDLEYHIFDVFFPSAIERGDNLESKYRQSYLDKVFKRLPSLQYIKRVEGIKVDSIEEAQALVDSFISDGYEGGILRRDNGVYRYSFNNYHSKDVLKIKPTFDDEFPIIGFTQGTKGKDLGALIWVCSLRGDKNTTFHVVPNLPILDRKHLFEELQKSPPDFDIHQKLLTVSYAELSAKGIPLQPKGVVVRDYE